jgi:hypothetical protein
LSIFYRIRENACGLLMFTIFTAGQVSVYLYKAVTGCVNWSLVGSLHDGIKLAQFVHLCVLILVIISWFQSYYVRKRGYSTQRSPGDVLVTCYVLLITLLLRAHNIPIVALMLLQVRLHREVIWQR